MNEPRVVIVVQQESLNERPRIHKFSRLLTAIGVRHEIWKFGDDTAPGVVNLLPARIRRLRSVARYLLWMASVAWRGLRHDRTTRFYGVGFDSAFPLSIVRPRNTILFDNIDNVSLSYKWPAPVKRMFMALERAVAHRAKVHVVPSRSRWSGNEPNLRIVTNTPSRAVLEEASGIAQAKQWLRGGPLTIYVNGWLSGTRGLATLNSALEIVHERGGDVRVLVAGRPACPDAEVLLRRPEVQNLGMLSNAEALATYYRADLAFIYYDPSVAINRLAESQKWTDCWATRTAFVTNSGIETAKQFISCGACFVCDYNDVRALADLLLSPTLQSDIDRTVKALSGMGFKYWDEEMTRVAKEWLPDTGAA